MNSFLFAFITGLTTGGISCFSVQGSFLTATLANETELNTSKNIRMKAIIVFLISKLIIYTLLGIFLGIIGRNLIVTPKFQGWLQIGIGVFMLLTAVNLANLHPFFKKFNYPSQIYIQNYKKSDKSKVIFYTSFAWCLDGFYSLRSDSSNDAFGCFGWQSFDFG